MVVLSLVGAVWFTVSVTKFHRGERCQSDFLVFYAAGKLAFTGYLYDPDAARQVYREAAGCPEFPLPIIRPPFYAAFLKPLSLLPYRWAYRVWHGMCALAIFAFVLLWPGDRWRALAVCAWSFPLMSNFIYGQDGPLILLVLGAAIRFLGRNEDRSAAIFALGAAKIHLFTPAGLWLIARRRWRYGRVMLFCGAILLALSFAAGGPNWIQSWVRAAMSPAAEGDPQAMMGVRSLTWGLVPGWVMWTAIVALAGFAYRFYRHADGAAALATIPAMGVLLTNHSFLYDIALCIPLVLVILEGEYPLWLRCAALVICLPVVHLLPAPGPLVLNAQWLTPCLVIGTMSVEFGRQNPGKAPR